jgi:hypothetical protein
VEEAEAGMVDSQCAFRSLWNQGAGAKDGLDTPMLRLEVKREQICPPPVSFYPVQQRSPGRSLFEPPVQTCPPSPSIFWSANRARTCDLFMHRRACFVTLG